MKPFFPIILATLLFSGCSRSPQQKEAKFLDVGRKHLQKREFERAALDFRNAVRAMPLDANPHYQLGLAYLESGNALAAAKELTVAVQLDPKHVGAQLKLAELMAINNNRDVVKKGEEKAQEVLALSPGNPDALNALAVAEMRLNDSTDAVEHLDQALQKVPQHLSSAITLAMVKLYDNDNAGAEQVLLKSVAEAPKSVEHAIVLGRFYLLLREPGKAEAQFRRALEIDPRSGPALVPLANLLNRAGKTDEAEQIFKRASALPDPKYRPLHAIFLLQHGKDDAAIAELDSQYKADREDRDARARLVAAYSRLGRSADAEKVLDEALKRNPKDADALIERGEFFLSAGKYDEAQKDLNIALRYRADSAQAHFILGRIHRARGASSDEFHELTEALRLDPKLLAARIELAHARTAANSAKSALDLLDQTPGQDKQSLAVIIERNAALLALGDYAQLKKGIDQGLAIARDPALVLQDGLLRLKLRDTRGGRASLEEVLKARPEEWAALEVLALSYVSEKKTAEAAAIVRKYTALAPKSAVGQQFLGTWLTVTGDHEGARSAFQAAKFLAPNSTTPDFALAELDLADGKLDSARSTLTGMLAKEPQNSRATLDLGYVEEKGGRLSEAMGYYEKTIQLAPQNVVALNNLAYLLADTGKDPDRALMLAQQVKELAPQDPNIDDTIGWAYYNKGLFKLAVDYMTKAETMSNARRTLHLAMAYARLGDRQHAQTLLKAALKQDSSLPETQKAIALIGYVR